MPKDTIHSVHGRPLSREGLRPVMPDLRQFAAVRRIALDDGPERGVRALDFTTGGGLDFWVLSDRCLDIGTLRWRGHPIAWQTSTGFPAPGLMDLEADGGWGFMRGFSGFMVTCGLDHVRQPRDGKPMHGKVPFSPARLLAYGEDWDRPDPVLFCEGEVDQAMHLAEFLRLRRRVEAPIGGSSLRFIDRVTNLGPEPQEHQLLYHINIGWPALDAGSLLSRDGAPLLPPFEPSGENRSTVSFPSGPSPQASCELSLPRLGARLRVGYDAATLPCLQIWRDPRPQRHVLGIEPCTSDRNADGASATAVVLQPGESRDYRVEILLSPA